MKQAILLSGKLFVLSLLHFLVSLLRNLDNALKPPPLLVLLPSLTPMCSRYESSHGFCAEIRIVSVQICI
eukprot:jgi/Botrbrau1/2355/Bobra.39_1s0039.1